MSMKPMKPLPSFNSTNKNNDYLTESIGECLFRKKLEFKYPQRQKIWMNSYKKLSSELQSKIDKVLSKHTLYRGGCYENSHIISLMIDEVDVVQGWMKNNDSKGLNNRGLFEMGTMIQDGEIIELKKNHLIGKNRNGISHYYNGETDEYWFRHCWNKYKNTHFDLTMELLYEWMSKSVVKKSEEWRYYFEVKTYDTSVLNNDSFRKDMFMNLIQMNNKNHFGKVKLS